MGVQLNHTIVSVRDRRESAEFLVSILGLPEPTRFGHFLVVRMDNDVSLDLCEAGDEKITMQHYAFLVSEAEFGEIFGRIRERAIEYWADPARTRPGETYRYEGDHGFYFRDPNGHLLEVITRPAGGD